MLNISIPLFTVFIFVWIIRYFYLSNLARSKMIRLQAKRGPITQEEVLKAVQNFGNNSNSFMTLYPGFKYFTSQDPAILGIIAYLELSHTWIGGAEPMANPENRVLLLKEFAQAASSLGKSAIFLPTTSEVARTAVQSAQYGQLRIGTEPTFNLNHYPKSGNTWIDVVPVAKALDAKGARVIEICEAREGGVVREAERKGSAIWTDDIKAEFNAITQEWLKSRKMEPLGFLNKVEPWTFSEHKRFFYLYYNNRIQAFITAIPVWPRKGWYLIDLVRRNDTPVGTTELLSLQAMRILKDNGASEITFGVSPLAGLNEVNDTERSTHPLLYKCLTYLYEKGGLYNFKSLFQFKLKFAPTHLEPVYLIYKNCNRERSKLTWFEIVNVFQAFSRNGILLATFSGVRRSITVTHLADAIKQLLKPSIVVRSAPRTGYRLLYRCKLLVSLTLLNLVLYFFTTDSTGNIFPSIERQWGYTWVEFLRSPIHALVLSPFLHWNLVHLNFNLVFLFLFTGGLEYLAGSPLTLLCYVIPMWFSNPITSFLLIRFGLTTPFEIDVGASLGIFGCGGALGWYFLKNRWLFIAPLCLITLLQSWDTQHWIIMNHWTAVILGILVGRFVLKT